MKNIFKSTLLLLSTVFLFAACADDNDSNPTLLKPTTFVLNATPYAASVIDLATSTGIPFTWNQPDYGFPIVTQYQFQVGVAKGDAQQFATIDDVFTTASGILNANKVASAINELMGWTELTEEEAAKLPATVSTLVRLAAHTAGTDTIFSNTVSLTLVPSLVVAPSFPEFIYMMGNFNGWTDPVALRSPAQDGIYSCFNWLDGGFKFRPNENNWDGDWGQDPNAALGKLVQEGEQDCQAAAGFYQIDVDLAAMTWSITPVTSISIIGTVNGNWDTDTDLTYNVATGAWETTATLTSGAMKFRMNHDWAISWGGANGDATAYDNLTQNNGKDLDLTENGTYFVQLFISYEGNNKVVITKQ